MPDVPSVRRWLPVAALLLALDVALVAVGLALWPEPEGTFFAYAPLQEAGPAEPAARWPWLVLAAVVLDAGVALLLLRRRRA